MAVPRLPIFFAGCLVLLAVTFVSLWRRPAVLPARWGHRPATARISQDVTVPNTDPTSTWTTSTSQTELSTTSTSLATSLPTSTSSSADPNSYSKLDRVLVVARQKEEDVAWIETELPDVTAAVYVVDDPNAELRVPRNKGHEAMVYLTYIIDHYDTLPAISIFVHSHRYAWHNNDLLDSDMATAVRRLNADYVRRQGYMNLRCHMQPGCSDNLRLDATKKDVHKPEVLIFRKVWDQLHPGQPLPKTLSAPCCAQFAVSGDRIRSISRDQYRAWRTWLLETELESGVSGRVWEYMWHYIFTGKSDLCPTMHACYCGGFGVCFGSAASTDAWFETREALRKLEDQQREAKAQTEEQQEELAAQITRMQEELEAEKVKALQRGLNPELRQKALAA